MRLLVLGGTMFLGRHLTLAARGAGHDVTIFHRGRTNPGLFTDVETLTGDRRETSDLLQLAGRSFDAVVDTCGYFPRDVRASAELIASTADRYVFVSSMSVYPDSSTPGQDETAPVGELSGDAEAINEITPDTYGPLKALCEREASSAFPGRSVAVRAGLIVGPYDPSDRFGYWVARVARGGRVLAPGRPERGVQLIDARDLAAWILHVCEAGTSGPYNVTSPPGTYTMGGILDSCLRATGSDARIVWADDDFIARHEVAPWSELPVWLPESEEYAGFHDASVDRALRDGLRVRGMDEIVADTYAWMRTLPADRQLHAGLEPTREEILLLAWDTERAA